MALSSRFPVSQVIPLFIRAARCQLFDASGADIIFRSFLVPTLGRYFHGSGSTASGLRAKADSLHTE